MPASDPAREVHLGIKTGAFYGQEGGRRVYKNSWNMFNSSVFSHCGGGSCKTQSLNQCRTTPPSLASCPLQQHLRAWGAALEPPPARSAGVSYFAGEN
jgi:hypothetical protein